MNLFSNFEIYNKNFIDYLPQENITLKSDKTIQYNPITNNNDEVFLNTETVNGFVGKFTLEEIQTSNNLITNKHRKVIIKENKQADEIEIDSLTYRIDYKEFSKGYTLMAVIRNG